MATLTEDNGGPARLVAPSRSDIPVGGVALLPPPSIHHIAPQMSYPEPRTVRTGKPLLPFSDTPLSDKENSKCESSFRCQKAEIKLLLKLQADFYILLTY